MFNLSLIFFALCLSAGISLYRTFAAEKKDCIQLLKQGINGKTGFSDRLSPQVEPV
jgi:hypothetical protein